eukprot:m.168355 g.168355  ORF g.168355 m.168355 type:complete len:227 (+) comp17788_c0_seq1:64-744(+)
MALVRVSLHGLLSRTVGAYSRALDANPLRTKMTTAFGIFTTADVVRQGMEARAARQLSTAEHTDCHHGKADASSTISITPAEAILGPAQPTTSAWDPWRTLRLAGFYSCVHAPWVHVWFNALDKMFGAAAGPRVVALKVIADQFVNMPVFMAVFLQSQSLMAGKTWTEAKDKVGRDHWTLVTGAWACWIPALSVIFSVVPLKYRLLTANFVQVGFGVFVSNIANRP